ncbi:FecR domain-containing protein [Paucibacter soli]|uniref:FecR domain-containing protein n=1 Tax=Paucibacter soli TaxID=3133433 RepID=UPI0030A39965
MKASVRLAGVMLLTACAAGAQTPAEADWRYRIQTGDTLIALTDAYLQPGHSWRELQNLNHVADPLRLPPGGVLRMPLAWLKREASVAEALFVQGQVTLSRPQQTEQRLQTGAELRSGDRLRSAAQSSASLRFVDGSRLLIPPLSDVTLEQLLVYGRSAIPAVRLRLHEGGADSQVLPSAGRVPHYEIRTPSVNLGVRGTEFRAQVDGAAARLQVLSGTVAADGQAVPAGMGLLADGQGRPRSAALLAAPDVGALPALLERLPLRFAWKASDGASGGWRAQVFARGDFTRLLLDQRSDAAQAAWPDDLPDGDYSLRLRAIDALGLEGRAAEHAFRLKARPEPPFIQGPAPAARLYGEAVDLHWTINTQARAYRLQIARDAGFGELVLEQAALSGNSHRAALPPGRYHWRLAALAADQGPWGDAQQFELIPVPPSPAPAEPELSGDGLQLRWRAEAGVARYELQWAGDAAFSQGLQSLASEQPAISLPRPGPGRYYLRLRCLDADGQAGPWGQVQLVNVPYPRWLWLLPLAPLLLAL